MKKRISFFLIVLCSLLLTNCTKKIQVEVEKEFVIKKNIAILPVLIEGNIAKKYADIARDYIEIEFTSYEEYNVIDRINIDKLLDEIKISQVGLTNKEVKEIGTFLNAEYILASKIYSANQSYIITGRIIEVETSKVIKTSSGKVTSLEFIDGASKGLSRRLTNRM